MLPEGFLANAGAAVPTEINVARAASRRSVFFIFRSPFKRQAMIACVGPDYNLGKLNQN
jgi:hypothetical protein